MAINLGDSKIGSYQIDTLLTTTTNSSLYRANAPGQPDGVIIRTLSRNAVTSSGDRQRFLDETQALTELRSEYVLTAIDSGTTDDDRPFVVLEDADRGSLQDRISGSSVPTVRDIDQLVIFLGSAIEDLQNQNLTIGDIDLENVLIKSSLRRSSADPGLLQEDEHYVLSDVGLGIVEGQHPFASSPDEGGMATENSQPPFNQDHVRTALTKASGLVAQVVCGSQPPPTTTWTTHLKNESRFPEFTEALVNSLDDDQGNHPGSIGLWSESLLNRPPPPFPTRMRREFALLTQRVSRRQGQVAVLVGGLGIAAVAAVLLASVLNGGSTEEATTPSGPTITRTATSSDETQPATSTETESSVLSGSPGSTKTPASNEPTDTSAPGTRPSSAQKTPLNSPDTTLPTTTSSSTSAPDTTTTDLATTTTTVATSAASSNNTAQPETTAPAPKANPTTSTTKRTPDPTAKPQPDPTPKPQPDPTPKPQPDPTPKPQPDPTPKPQPDPTTPEEKPDIPPEPVTDLRVLSTTENSVTVGWSAAPGGVGYQMVNQKDPEDLLGADQTSHTFTGNIHPGRNYLFEVATVGTDDRVSAYAAVLSKTPGIDTTSQNKAVNPTGLAASSTGTSISVTWENVPGNSGYAIFLNHKTNIGGTEPDETSSTISGLEPNRSYLVEIRTQFAGPEGNSERVPIVVRTKG